MDIFEWTFLLLKPILAVVGCICIPKSILPIKRAWKTDDQKLMNKGISVFVFGIACIVFFILIIKRG